MILTTWPARPHFLSDLNSCSSSPTCLCSGPLTALFLKHVGHTLLKYFTFAILSAQDAPSRCFHVLLTFSGLCSDIPISVRPSLTTLMKVVHPVPHLCLCCFALPFFFCYFIFLQSTYAMVCCVLNSFIVFAFCLFFHCYILNI